MNDNWIPIAVAIAILFGGVTVSIYSDWFVTALAHLLFLLGICYGYVVRRRME